MDDYIITPYDEFMHTPDASPNFNESVYVNFTDPAGIAGWMRLGNRANEGYAELSVCLYLPDGRIACQFQRPITHVTADGIRIAERPVPDSMTARASPRLRSNHRLTRCVQVMCIVPMPAIGSSVHIR